MTSQAGRKRGVVSVSGGVKLREIAYVNGRETAVLFLAAFTEAGLSPFFANKLVLRYWALAG